MVFPQSSEFDQPSQLYGAGSSLLNPSVPEAAASDPHATATGVYVTIHGHFYQPPRENPYLDAIERQSSAAPFHNWNERIHHECYRPNAFARVLNDQGELLGVVNNFEYFSFNIGPTLMSWLEQYDPEVYRRILEADCRSCARLNGHGNAIAQVYNHIILPLANRRDKYTQIRWGIADFKTRFGRDPEGMWLAETAVDYPTLRALVDEGIRFTILAPSQAQRCRPIPNHDNPDPAWLEVGGSQIDPIQPYRCFLPEGDYIDIFFYDGPISRDMGFGEVLSSSHQFAARLGQAVRGDRRPSQLVSVATDGETFGHHKGGTEKALAYAFVQEFPQRGWTVTNFAHYLSINPPTWEVVLKPVTAWSCAHGVDRWQDDCGCGGGGVWHQQWRRPLRDSLDWLRDNLIQVFDTAGRQFFTDPWRARDEYVAVVGDRSLSTINRFLERHQTRKLNHAEQVDALRLLEMQRHALLMYTSCGWFFEEVSRPEGTQILRYAARAIELAEDVTDVQLESAFVERLGTIPSNVELFGNGTAIYHQLVDPAKISLEQVAAHYAISSLFTAYPAEHQVYAYDAQRHDHHLRRLGALTLSVGQLQLTSEMTRETVYLVYAVLHLGGWDFHCCIQPYAGRRAYNQIKQQIMESLNLASAAQVILEMNRVFGDQSFSLQSLFAEERHRIMRLLSQETLTRLDQLYTQVYRDNYGVLMAFHRDGLAVPQELQVAAEIAIAHRAMVSLQALEREASDLPLSNLQRCESHLMELEAIAAEAQQFHCQLQPLEIQQTLERLVWRSLWNLTRGLTSEAETETLAHATPAHSIQFVAQLVRMAQQLCSSLRIDRTQELYLDYLHTTLLPQLEQQAIPSDTAWHLLQLGQALSIDVSAWQSACSLG
ncbi:MAG: DUF3536 domain-containing protein [Kaiparowitsia implicata GSE-PSE-MK54-09C]|jgi:alpha-amylase/alpha-mannosidase (GH57 family)|nr:DUF3536 domain-containing protein [Kaiparowitsia implicata GSE-PSE-MK54-09C]